MKISRSPILEVTVLLIWIVLLALQFAETTVYGMATVYLPISIIALLINQLKKTRPVFDLTIVFLLSCLFFFCIGLILWPISSFSPVDFSSLVIVTFNWSQLDKAAIWIGMSIAITMTTLMTIRCSDQSQIKYEFLSLNDPRQRGLYKVGVILITLSLPVVTIESINQLRFIQNAGYLALFVDGIPVSSTSKAFLYVFNLGFGLILAFARTRVEFLAPAILFLIVATLDSLKGARGVVIVPILFVAWYYTSRFYTRIRLMALIRNLALLVSLFICLTYLRDAELFNKGIGQFLIDALSSQGRSLQLTALYLEVADTVAQFGNSMVFSNLLIPIIALVHPEVREAAQSMDQVLYSNNLKHILTYVLNDSYYFAGGGTGGVYIIELIESGPLGYLLLSMGLGWFLAWLPKAMSRAWVRYLSVYIFSTVFYMPRAEFFFNTLIVGKALFLYFVVSTLYGKVLYRGIAANKVLPLTPVRPITEGQQ